MFELQQRFEMVNQVSTFHAAIRFIPFTVAASVGSILASTVAKMLKVPLLYLLGIGSSMQVVSYVLLGTVSGQDDISARQYGYQVLAGLACGINIPLLTLMTRYATERKAHDVTEAAQKPTGVIATLPAGTQDLIRGTYAASHDLQMKVLAGLAGGQVLATMAMWQPSPSIIY
ncbi:uncharacterized protein BO66DRAFT_440995 [Aspergillus aculeatinus CBS 121060]|uniref:Uncharacterized protein n=1 Tax=Aspergillus aculeatinus CBS 121060 TaxID=1448322 RepID=A0ACD1H1W4_9EURO|nr:hypothetical protein BO66DRAFT_440995 [Aspergillus aculeatinus CBS 121060]RAH67538.1 hypothetical protein BO66DRAFT_440995 [Aspergillus aculeatinus CBS 121060]